MSRACLGKRTNFGGQQPAPKEGVSRTAVRLGRLSRRMPGRSLARTCKQILSWSDFFIFAVPSLSWHLCCPEPVLANDAFFIRTYINEKMGCFVRLVVPRGGGERCVRCAVANGHHERLPFLCDTPHPLYRFVANDAGAVPGVFSPARVGLIDPGTQMVLVCGRRRHATGVVEECRVHVPACFAARRGITTVREPSAGRTVKTGRRRAGTLVQVLSKPGRDVSCEKTVCFLVLPCVCPEPVLVK